MQNIYGWGGGNAETTAMLNKMGEDIKEDRKKNPGKYSIGSGSSSPDEVDWIDCNDGDSFAYKKPPAPANRLECYKVRNKEIYLVTAYGRSREFRCKEDCDAYVNYFLKGVYGFNKQDSNVKGFLDNSIAPKI